MSSLLICFYGFFVFIDHGSHFSCLFMCFIVFHCMPDIVCKRINIFIKIIFTTITVMLLLLLGCQYEGLIQSHLQWSWIWALSQLQFFVVTTGFKRFDDGIQTCPSAGFSETPEMSVDSFNCLWESSLLSSPASSFLYLRGPLFTQLPCSSLWRTAVVPSVKAQSSLDGFLSAF